MRNHVISPDVGELAFTDYVALLEEDPSEARARLEALLLNAEALEYYVRVLACLADDSGPAPRCTLDNNTVLEILSDGLQDISVGFLRGLVLDGDALSELQCLVIELDNPRSYWCRNQGPTAPLRLARKSDLDSVEEVGNTSDPNGYHGVLPTIISCQPGLGRSPAAPGGLTTQGGVWLSHPTTDTSLATNMVMTHGGRRTNLLRNSTRSSQDLRFRFETREDVSRLDEHLGEMLSLMTASGLSAERSEEVRLLAIGRLRSLSIERESESISLEDADIMLRAAYRQICRSDRAGIRRRIAWRPRSMQGTSDHPQRDDASEDAFCSYAAMTDLERTVLLKRFLEYEPIHQISRELGLNQYVVRRICERTRREIMNGRSGVARRAAASNARRTASLGTSSGDEAEQSSSGLYRMGVRSIIARAHSCLFWLGLGALMTALMAGAGRREMMGEVTSLILAYIVVTFFKSSWYDEAKSGGSGDGSGAPLPCI